MQSMRPGLAAIMHTGPVVFYIRSSRLASTLFPPSKPTSGRCPFNVQAATGPTRLNRGSLSYLGGGAHSRGTCACSRA
jgi:hypothetical protein